MLPFKDWTVGVINWGPSSNSNNNGCVNSWPELQADDFNFVCRGCMTVKYLQEQVIELRHMILMMTGQGETEVSRGGENDESRGGETKESRGGETEESRGGETKDMYGGGSC